MTIDDLLLRRAVVCASAIVYWGGVAIQARRIRKRIGKSANLKPRTPKEKLLWAGWTFMILGWLIQPLLISGTNFSSPSPPEKEERAGVRSHGFSTTETSNSAPLTPALSPLGRGEGGEPTCVRMMSCTPSLLTPLTLTLGIALIILGYAATLWCYSSMGDTWRIGVNRNEKTALVTRGPYRVIRHPIYGFQIVMLAGAALLLPTIFSLLILAIHFVCVQAKAADEESYLLSVHGETYREYVNRTGRLFPKLIR
jgi:protein-S-isoprenylcysteine O-methyltransferase Ste14